MQAIACGVNDAPVSVQLDVVLSHVPPKVAQGDAPVQYGENTADDALQMMPGFIFALALLQVAAALEFAALMLMQ